MNDSRREECVNFVSQWRWCSICGCVEFLMYPPASTGPSSER